MNNKLQQIVERMFSLYVAEDGLGRLQPFPGDTRPSFKSSGYESVFNENGVLYRAYAMVKAIQAGYELAPVDRFELRKLLESLMEQPGLLNRWPDGNTVFQRHDDYVGACAIARLAADPCIPASFITYAWRNWFCFNNVAPGAFAWPQVRQPGEVALYYIAAGRTPPFTFVLWLCAGLLIQCFSSKTDAAQARLSWLRLWIIKDAGVKGPLSRLALWATRKLWFKYTARKFGNTGAALFNFGPEHPVTLFQELIDDASSDNNNNN